MGKAPSSLRFAGALQNLGDCIAEVSRNDAKALRFEKLNLVF